VAILFVSDRKSWEEMSQIERELGKEIVKISTDDFDAMEQVSWVPSTPPPLTGSE
jgi:hypothetical protein